MLARKRLQGSNPCLSVLRDFTRAVTASERAPCILERCTGPLALFTPPAFTPLFVLGIAVVILGGLVLYCFPTTASALPGTLLTLELPVNGWA